MLPKMGPGLVSSHKAEVPLDFQKYYYMVPAVAFSPRRNSAGTAVMWVSKHRALAERENERRADFFKFYTEFALKALVMLKTDKTDKHKT